MLLKTVAIIQARMQSSRLPGKVLADVAGRPMLQHVVDRARRAVNLDAVVVATSDRTADDCVAEFCEGAGVGCYRGSRDDVLDRYFRAAEHFAAQTIVRLTADCPLLDPGVIDRVVEKFRAGAFDYVSNTIGCTYPDGLDTEVISRAALERAWNEAELRSEREHVTAYVVNHSELFRLGCVRHELDLSALRWTVDHPADLEFVRAVYDACGPGPFAMKEVLQLLRRQPQLSEINQGIARNAGYSKSLHEDSLVGGPKSR